MDVCPPTDDAIYIMDIDPREPWRTPCTFVDTKSNILAERRHVMHFRVFRVLYRLYSKENGAPEVIEAPCQYTRF